jgi:hypothetical protein
MCRSHLKFPYLKYVAGLISVNLQLFDKSPGTFQGYDMKYISKIVFVHNLIAKPYAYFKRYLVFFNVEVWIFARREFNGVGNSQQLFQTLTI